jgi:hypothetical protein
MNKGFLTEIEGLTDFTTDITYHFGIEEELTVGLEKIMLKTLYDTEQR